MEITRFLLDVALNMLLAVGCILFGFQIGVLKERYRQRMKMVNSLREIIEELEKNPLEGINDLVRKQIIIEYANRTMDFLKADMVWEEAVKSKKKLPKESLEENSI